MSKYTRDPRILSGRPQKATRQPFDYSSVEIEKGIDIPNIRQVGRPAYELAGQMEVEDSILLPTNNSSALMSALNRHWGPGSAVSRKMGEGFTRVWRIRNKEERDADKLTR